MNRHSRAMRLKTLRRAAVALPACLWLSFPVQAQTSGQNTGQNTGRNTPVLPVGLQSADPYANDPASGQPVGTNADTPAATVVPTPRPEQTPNGVIGARTEPGSAIPEPVDEAIEPADRRDNIFEPTVDGGEKATVDDGTAPGIRIGTLTLRPSISQTINHENKKFPAASTNRTYLATGIRGTLTSDWSRHALTVSGEGVYERNISGGSAGENPSANVQAELRLDLADQTTARLKAGYAFSREDTSDPNAISGASIQGGEHLFTAGGSIERNIGLVKALAALDLSRTIYTDAKGINGQSISLADRDRSGVALRGRVGYEMSPALVPFLEATGALSTYDNKTDSIGYQRSSTSYGAKVGTQIDLGEKWRGEVAVGLLRRDYDDNRLASVNALTTDGTLTWSPMRGTDVNFGLKTDIEDFAGGARGGWVTRQLTVAVIQQLRNDLVARLSSGLEHRNFQTDSIDNQIKYSVGAGLTWKINRYLDFTTDLTYETTPVIKTSDWRIGAGLTLRR
ncbi:outer membrane beta-barrel protein [uncultured Agrobacterium sp.]|uniref:surface lipoprotein assembly modifier n=1 Tax=uncultured Agrobacterium sp. TaxID=157277 RepID=UPI0025D9775B|nr:outer membrane beta-barrel protein [uncultured Agrobacterium sp.]